MRSFAPLRPRAEGARTAMPRARLRSGPRRRSRSGCRARASSGGSISSRSWPSGDRRRRWGRPGRMPAQTRSARAAPVMNVSTRRGLTIPPQSRRGTVRPSSCASSGSRAGAISNSRGLFVPLRRPCRALARRARASLLVDDHADHQAGRARPSARKRRSAGRRAIHERTEPVADAPDRLDELRSRALRAVAGRGHRRGAYPPTTNIPRPPRATAGGCVDSGIAREIGEQPELGRREGHRAAAA